jgi:hypothetical protein
MADQAWEMLLLISSVPLRRLDERQEVIGSASGALIHFKDHRLLLMAEHSIHDGGRWAIEVRYCPGKGAELFGLPPLQLFAGIDIEGAPRTIDLAYAKIPLDVKPLFQELSARGEIFNQCERAIFASDLDTQAAPGIKYGFSGQNLRERTEGAIFPDIRLEPNLTFIRETGGLYEFALNHPHPGDEFCRGCSGSPILSEDGDVVALLVGGSESDATVRGVPLFRYSGAIAVSLGLCDGQTP